MRVLFLHPNFPGQFLNLASFLARDKANEVVFLTQRQETELAGVKKVLFEVRPYQPHEIHPYIMSVEKALMQGEAACMKALELKKNGFNPDIVCGHSGWGSTMFMKDVFPQAAFIGYFEWYTNSRGGCLDFDPQAPLDLDTAFSARMSNIPLLTDLYTCDAGLSPTYWQRSQFPHEFHEKIRVIHDGIDTDYFQPDIEAERFFPEVGLDLRKAKEIVTYVGRGMEPYRGFPQFMEAVALLQQRRPECHVVIVGADRMAYGGRKAPHGKTYKEWMLDKLDLDLTRLHFTGPLPYYRYRQVLQMSSVHVYLTVPFVLSWSMLEAMASECLLVASATKPVQEVIEDGVNGFLTDFFDEGKLADKLCEVLAQRDGLQAVRRQARNTIVQRYAMLSQLKEQVCLFQELCCG